MAARAGDRRADRHPRRGLHADHRRYHLPGSRRRARPGDRARHGGLGVLHRPLAHPRSRAHRPRPARRPLRPPAAPLARLPQQPAEGRSRDPGDRRRERGRDAVLRVAGRDRRRGAAAHRDGGGHLRARSAARAYDLRGGPGPARGHPVLRAPRKGTRAPPAQGGGADRLAGGRDARRDAGGEGVRLGGVRVRPRRQPQRLPQGPGCRGREGGGAVLGADRDHRGGGQGAGAGARRDPGGSGGDQPRRPDRVRHLREQDVPAAARHRPPVDEGVPCDGARRPRGRRPRDRPRARGALGLVRQRARRRRRRARARVLPLCRRSPRAHRPFAAGPGRIAARARGAVRGRQVDGRSARRAAVRPGRRQRADRRARCARMLARLAA